MREKRLEIDALNILFCMMVVFVHVCSEAVSGLQRDSWQLFAIYIPWRAFHFVVPAFLFLSALKLFYKKEQGYKENYLIFIKRRFCSVFAPYAVWVLVYYLYFIHIGYFRFSLKDYLGYLFMGNIVAPFYFIITIMQFYLLMPLWEWAMKKLPVWAFLLLALAVTLFIPQFRYSDRVFTSYLFYWALGCLAGSNISLFSDWLRRYRIAVCGVFVLLLTLDSGLSYLGYRGIYSFPYLEYIRILFSATAILALYSLALYVRRLPRLLSDINKSAYQIYLMHSLFIFIVNDKLTEYGITSIGVRTGIKCIILFAIIIVFSIAYAAWKSSRSAKKTPRFSGKPNT